MTARRNHIPVTSGQRSRDRENRVANTYAVVTGNLTRDPEIRFTPNGQQVTAFGLAVNESYVDKASGRRVEQPASFYDVVVWGDQGNNVAESLGKGDRAVVSGQLRQRTWEVDGDGGAKQKRSKVEIRATEVGASLLFDGCKVIKAARSRPAPVDALVGALTAALNDEEPF